MTTLKKRWSRSYLGTFNMNTKGYRDYERVKKNHRKEGFSFIKRFRGPRRPGKILTLKEDASKFDVYLYRQ